MTSISQLLFILKIALTFFTKQGTLMRRSIVLRFPPQLVFPVCSKVKFCCAEFSDLHPCDGIAYKRMQQTNNSIGYSKTNHLCLLPACLRKLSVFAHTFIPTDRLTDIHTNRQTDKQIGRINRHTDTHTHIEADTQTDIQAG